MVLFQCKTTNATVFKYMFDMLFHNMSTVPISVSSSGFTIFNKTDTSYTFSVKFPAEKFSEWQYNHSQAIFFGLGTLNSQDFKELSSKSTMEMIILPRKSPLESIILNIIVTNNTRALLKRFTLHSEEIPFFPLLDIPKTGAKLSMKTQDFTSLCKGFKTGIIHMKCTDEGFSIVSKLEGVREKCFLFPEKLAIQLDTVFSADKFLGLIKLAMCVKKTIDMWLNSDCIIVSGETALGPIDVRIDY